MTSALNRNYPEIQGEFELEDEFETEDEFESEFETEDEGEFDAEDEDEDFLGLAGGIGKVLGGLLGGGGDGEYEAEFEFEAEAETEQESEEEYEDEAFVNPVRRIYPDAELMAHLSTRAAQTSSEADAEAFLGALVPIASKLIPRAAGRPSDHAAAGGGDADQDREPDSAYAARAGPCGARGEHFRPPLPPARRPAVSGRERRRPATPPRPALALLAGCSPTWVLRAAVLGS